MNAVDSSAEMCVLCCREIQIYAVGQCDHPVCHECSTRMRVLCEQNECPICRGDMAYVLFTHHKRPFLALHNFPLLDKRYMIAFEDEKAQKAFKELLKHKCKLCEESFDAFKGLETHVRRQHNMQYCELCVESLKIFTFERKVYSRRDLAHHKRHGDVDDKSHRGHPMCEFCLQRFVDHDERFRHLRKEHFFCHFCDADGLHKYYNDYSYLRDHFRKDHFLCEEGECAKEQQFISSAFRTKIDLQAHKARNHSKNKTKAEVKQARTLELEFLIAPRLLQNGERSPNHSENRRGRYRSQVKNLSAEEISDRDSFEDTQDAKHQISKVFNTGCVEEFPTLSGGSEDQANVNVWLSGSSQYRTSQRGKNEDFPALTSVTSSKKNSKNSTDSQHKTFKSLWNDPQRLGKLSRPGSAESSEKAKSRGWGAIKVTKSEEEFPRLQTKKTFSSETERPIPEPELQRSKQVIITSQIAEQLGQEIYSKCKSKKKKKNKNSTIDSETNTIPFESKGNSINPADLSKMYSGLSDRNTNGNEENQDPLQAAKQKSYNYERPKKMEDNFEDTPWSEKPNFIADDFPPLEVSENKARGPPGFSTPVISNLPVPPPGFSSRVQSAPKVSGTSISLKSVAEQLTSDKIKQDSKLEESKYSYKYPPCFQERNNTLTTTIYGLLESNNELFEKFRILSGNFRKGNISAQEYHTQCLSILGNDEFNEIFTELVCLLPDIKKQQELLSVHDKIVKDQSKNRGAVPKHKSASVSSRISKCQECNQILANSDHLDHVQSHKNK